MRGKTKKCPGACSNGRIKVFDGSEAYTVPCHLLSKYCDYGQRIYRRAHSGFMDALQKSGIPHMYMRIMLTARIMNTPAIRAVRAWDWDKKNCLVLLGDSGIGKSFAAAVAYQRWCARLYAENGWADSTRCAQAESAAQHNLCWLRALDVTTCSFTWRRDDKGRSADWLACPFLVLDDLGTEEGTARNISIINYVLSVRYDGCLPTVITSNLDVSGFYKRYGARVADRLCEAGQIVALTGENLRVPHD